MPGVEKNAVRKPERDAAGRTCERLANISLCEHGHPTEKKVLKEDTL